MRKRAPNQGFTLVEILVILAIVAVLAGVLIPSVARQITKGEAGRVLTDFEGIRTGAEAFVSDLKRYPGDVEDLLTQPDEDDRDVNGDPYPAGLIVRWKGPYTDVTLDQDSVLGTGYGGKILNDLIIVTDAATNDFLAMQIQDMTESEFTRIDEAIDSDTITANRPLLGRARYTASIVELILMPIGN